LKVLSSFEFTAGYCEKVETSDDKPVVPVSIHNISVVDEL
jgi:hypothetical protein